MKEAEYTPFPEENRLEDKCGLFAIFSDDFTNNLKLTIKGAGGVQHRGQQGVGITQMTKSGEINTFRGPGLIREALTEELIRENNLNQPSLWELFHCRYGTSGGYGTENIQPIITTTNTGEEFALIHNGEIVITDEMRQAAPEASLEHSDTYYLSRFIAAADGKTLEDKLQAALPRVKGSYSLIIGSSDRLLLARDEFGIKPLIVGSGNGKKIIASETHAFDKIGAPVIRELKRGEITRVDRDGFKIIKEGLPGQGFECSFENPYIRRPDSLFPLYKQNDDNEHPDRWRSVLRYRERTGEILADEAPIHNASFIVGVPDSGVGVATGYANALKIPYRQVILRDHYDPNGDKRLFQTDNEINVILSKVLGKLSLVPDPEIWQDAIVVVGDDSIVRGSVSHQITAAIRNLGAREIHWISGYPMIKDTCHLGVSLRTKQELIAPRNDSDPIKIAEELRADSVNFISHKGILAARYPGRKIISPQNPNHIFLANGECGGCLTGIHPVNKEGIIYQQGLLTAA
jgi:amidophosphoribosyltransferase